MGRPISGEYRHGRRLLTGVLDPSGLDLPFELDGPRVSCTFEADRKVTHGARVVPTGFLQSVCEDLAHATLAALKKRIGITRESRLRFLKPLYANDTFRAVGTLFRDADQGVVQVQAQIFNSKGQLCFEGEVEVFLLDAQQVRRMTPDGMVPLELKRYF